MNASSVTTIENGFSVVTTSVTDELVKKGFSGRAAEWLVCEIRKIDRSENGCHCMHEIVDSDEFYRLACLTCESSDDADKLINAAHIVVEHYVRGWHF